ncbi:MAG TPA: CheR family methyltransferase, partial [Candidatus Obscuribacterales bacterium]
PGLQVRDDLRQRVTFQYGNLVQDAFPAVNSALQEIDLIICRNVFIYFDSGAIAQTLAKFHRALAPEGYLITGHTELQGQDTHQFHLKVFPESLVYQRRAEPLGVAYQPAAARSPAVAQGAWLTGVALPSQRPAASGTSGSPTVALPSPPAPPAPTPPEPAAPPDAIAIALAAAQASLVQKAYLSAIQEAEAICAAVPDHFEAQLILAKAHANRGNHDQAAKICQQALRLQPLSLELHYLAAQIAEERGDLDGAKEHLRRIIYLDAGEFKAYLDLASLYQRERRFDQVKKMEQLALKTLNLLPTTAIVDAEDGTTVLDWRHYLESKLAG